MFLLPHPGHSRSLLLKKQAYGGAPIGSILQNLAISTLTHHIKENDMSRASDLERQMLDLINEERTSRGLDAVELELRLNESSEDHSQWMLDENRFSHTGQGGSSAGDRMRDADFPFEGSWTWGENIAYQSERGAPGLADDVENLHDALMDSPGHRANILNPDFEVVGLGIETGDFNGFDAVMVTQNFAATDAELQIDEGGATSAEPVAEAPEPERDTPEPDPTAPVAEEPVAEAPAPEADDPTEEEPEEPVAEMPEPEPETPEDPVSETPEPEPDMPEPEPPVAEAPDEDQPEEPVDAPVKDTAPDSFAQAQFFLTGFLGALFDEEFTFAWSADDTVEPQTMTFDIDTLFADLFGGADSGDPSDDDMMMAEDDVASDDGSGFHFTQDWDCLA